MDFRQILKTHKESGADATIAVLPVRKELTPELGLAKIDNAGWVTGFVEKPKTDDLLVPLRLDPDWLRQRGVQDLDKQYLANMGIYLFKRQALFDLLYAPPLATDFGKEVFPRGIQTHRVMAHVFDGYWEDLGTIKAFHEANLSLCGDDPPFDFHSPEGVIYTRMRFLPASRVVGATLRSALVSDGCVIHPGAQIVNSLIGVRSIIGRDVRVRDSVVIGADQYETEAERAANRARGLPGFSIGDGSVIEQAIIDKDCRIGRGVRITNKRNLREADGENYVIREGIVVIPNDAILPDGTVI
jgi:glucose-1-phosphate adenylyltransferase